MKSDEVLICYPHCAHLQTSVYDEKRLVNNVSKTLGNANKLVSFPRDKMPCFVRIKYRWSGQPQ